MIAEGNVVRLDDKYIRFTEVIKKASIVDGTIVVLLNWENDSTSFENVFGLDENLHVKWQIERMAEFEHEGKMYKGIDKPYVDYYENSDKSLTLINYDGTKIDVNPQTGQVLKNPILSRFGRRPW